MHVAVSIVLVLVCGLAAAQPPPGTGEATLANLRKAENFWSSPQWLDTSLPNKERFGSYFHPEGEWCLGKVCGKGYDGLAEVADGFANMLSHLRVVVTEPFLSDAKYHAGGRWVDTLVCKARGDLVFQLTGAVFIEVDPETGLIMRESDIIDYDMLASAAAACTGLPGAMFKPPGSVNKELLDTTIREQDEVWQALMSRNRIPDDQIASFVKASAAPGAEVCFNTDAGCMELGGPAFVEQLKQWRSVVSDMQLEYSSERRYAPGAVGVRWVGHYGCVNGGTPMANSGYLLYHIDDSGKIQRVINAFYEIGVVRQIGECLSQDSGAHPEL